MSAQRWRLTVYDLAPTGHYIVPTGGHAFVYAADGDTTVTGTSLAQDAGSFATAGDTVSASAIAWIYELVPGASLPPRQDGLSPVLSRAVSLPEGAHLLRADRVESAAGAQTPAHRHQGPGIRRLRRGLLLAEVGDHLDRIEAGQAWFESGHETVVGTNISGATNAFVRVMLLPVALAGGKSSFIPANPQEAAKPRAANLTLFGERPL
ncbi:hypothetical protein [Bosea sp. BK604]|uniref:hypothetical protein n=1 Tax=Bosea sp. BK604 TaxID=2512180 RepID=UPI0010474CF5|nr:hypothetical protein [Bosea sp. BK604]TCR66406.1 hypothetical protein EV560_104286 [Bosea sp. BK604]